MAVPKLALRDKRTRSERYMLYVESSYDPRRLKSIQPINSRVIKEDLPGGGALVLTLEPNIIYIANRYNKSCDVRALCVCASVTILAFKGVSNQPTTTLS